MNTTYVTAFSICFDFCSYSNSHYFNATSNFICTFIIYSDRYIKANFSNITAASSSFSSEYWVYCSRCVMGLCFFYCIFYTLLYFK